MSTSTPPRSLSGWCTISHAASVLDVSRDTIRRMIGRGEVYAERVGPRLIRVDLGSIQRQPLTSSSLDFDALRERLLVQLPAEAIDATVLVAVDRLAEAASSPAPSVALRRERAVDERVAAGVDE